MKGNELLHNNAHDTEAKALASANITTDCEIVFRLIDNAGMIGLTSKEIARSMDKPLNAISGRLTQLKNQNLITDSGERREGCRVMIIKPAGK